MYGKAAVLHTDDGASRTSQKSTLNRIGV